MKKIEFNTIIETMGIEIVPNEFRKQFSERMAPLYKYGDVFISFEESNVFVKACTPICLNKIIDYKKVTALLFNTGKCSDDYYFYLQSRDALIDFLLALKNECSLDAEKLKNEVKRKLFYKVMMDDSDDYNKMLEISRERVNEKAELLKSYLDDFDKVINPFLDTDVTLEDISDDFGLNISMYPSCNDEIIINHQDLQASSGAKVISVNYKDKINLSYERKKILDTNNSWSSEIIYKLELWLEKNQKLTMRHVESDLKDYFIVVKTKLHQDGSNWNDYLVFDLRIGEFSCEGLYDFEPITDEDLNEIINLLNNVCRFGKNVFRKDSDKTIEMGKKDN